MSHFGLKQLLRVLVKDFSTWMVKLVLEWGFTDIISSQDTNIST